MKSNSARAKKSALIVLALCLNFNGCSDDPVTSSNNTVTGTLLDFESHPVSNVEIKIENQSVMTSADGSFTFNNVTMPYDLLVLDQVDKGYYRYNGISTTNFRVPSFFGYTGNSVKAVFHVTVPPEMHSPELKGKIFFNSGNNINVVSDIESESFYIYLPLRDQIYKGKIRVLTYKTDDEGNITSYENFAESPEITIDHNNSWEYFYNFTLQQFSFNPEEKNISVNFSHPPGFSSTEGSFYLNFSDIRIPFITNQLKIQNVGDVFNLVVPANLPLSYNLMLSKQTGGAGSTFEDFIIDKTMPSANFETKIPPTVISPPDNISNVDGNTNFSVQGGNGEGVYVSLFYNITDDTRYSITGTSASMNFSEVQKFGTNISNSEFSWSVYRTGPANDMNDYVKNIHDKKTFFSNSTPQQHFTTAK